MVLQENFASNKYVISSVGLVGATQCSASK